MDKATYSLQNSMSNWYSKYSYRNEFADITHLSIIVKLNKKYEYPDTRDLNKFAKDKNIYSLQFLQKKKLIRTAKALVFSIDGAALKNLEVEAVKKYENNYISLSLFWKINFDQHIGPKKVEQYMESMKNDKENIDDVYYAPIASTPSITPSNDPFFPFQNYTDPAPIGIDAKYAWNLEYAGGTIGFVDVEMGWNLNHQDLDADSIKLIAGDNRFGFNGYKGYHGSSVIGIVKGIDNDLGIIGIANAKFFTGISSHFNTEDYTSNVADAIVTATDYRLTKPGDIILIEAAYSHGGQTAALPIEVYEPDRSAIMCAAASGYIVIEASGNSDQNLDNLPSAYGSNILERGHTQFIDSGAIMVAACQREVKTIDNKVGHEKIPFSNYGSRIDCYAWGEEVVSVGERHYSGNQTPRLFYDDYTNQFSGTSAAAAIVAGAAIIVQDAHMKIKSGTLLSNDLMRSKLSNATLNTPSIPSNAKIGVMPDLHAIIESLNNVV